jgi:homopolymeric O-antigen transport system permease protein
MEARFFDHDRVRVIRASRGLRFPDPAELWAYRSLLWMLVLRDIRVRHKQTLLGAGWAVIQPTAHMVVMTLVFGRLAGLSSEGHPYALFVFAALLPWTFFSNAVGASANSLLASAQLVRKVYFPRIFVPTAAVTALLLDLAIATSALLLLIPLYGRSWSWSALAIPLLMAGVFLAALGVGSLLAALAASYRDFRNVVPFLLQVWLFATPVVYSAEIIPERFRWLLWLNPMAGLADGYRSAVLGTPFRFWALVTSASVAAALALAGLAYFQREQKRFADVI